MKKVLVLSLVLVMALASSAFAAVNFGGKFTASVSTDSFTDGDLNVDSKLEINIDDKAGDEGNWSFEAKTSLKESKFELGEYKLELNDDYFDLYFWGKGKELTEKKTTLGLISAGKAAAGHRARLVVDAVEPVTLTADFTNDTLYVFADANIAGYDAGLAYMRNGGLSDDNAKNTVGAWGKATVDMFTIQGDVAATFVEKVVDEDAEDPETKTGVALGYAAKVSADVTEEVNVWAQYSGKQDGFAGSADKSKLSLGATYEEAALQVTGTFTPDIDAKSNTVEVGAKYRFSEKVGYGDLFKSDKYYNNDAPAVGLSAKLDDFAINNVTLNVASPVVEDMVWARAEAKYLPTTEVVEDEEGEDEEKTVNNFELGAYARIKATDKLTIDPAVVYKTNGSVIDLSSTASYLIGSSDTALKLTVQKVMTEEGFTDADGNLVAKELVKAAVEVKF